MRKFIFTVFIVMSTVNVYTQEMQISGGLEFGGGVSTVDNSFWSNSRYGNLYFKEDSTSAFFAPGISFTVRVFSDDNDISRGFVFRDRAIFITNAKTTGTLTVGGALNYSEKATYTTSISDDELTSIMDFGFGQSTRFKISKRLQFYTDLGFNFTWMDYEDYETKSTLSYLGAGIFSDAALQINLTKDFYLELGLNSIINIFSSQNGRIKIPELGVNTKYEDAGRFDLISTAFYIHFGRRFDLQKLRNDLLNPNTSVNTSNKDGGQ